MSPAAAAAASRHLTGFLAELHVPPHPFTSHLTLRHVMTLLLLEPVPRVSQPTACAQRPEAGLSRRPVVFCCCCANSDFGVPVAKSRLALLARAQALLSKLEPSRSPSATTSTLPSLFSTFQIKAGRASPPLLLTLLPLPRAPLRSRTSVRPPIRSATSTFCATL